MYVLAPLAVTVGHAAITNGHAALTTLRRGPRSFGFWSILSGHFAAVVVAICLAALAVALAAVEPLLSLLPSVSELSATLWTAAVAAVLGAYLVRVSNRPTVTVFDLVARSRSGISERTWSFAAEIARQNGADPAVVQSIMLVENLQRPRWVRAIENIKARLGWRGTYGIMQVDAKRFITDEESIRISCEQHLRGASPAQTAHGSPEQDSIAELVRRHNPDPTFVDMVLQVYWQVRETN